MTEELPAGMMGYSTVLVYNTPAGLQGRPTGDRPMLVTLDPPAIYVPLGGRWVSLASVEGNVPAPTVVPATEDAAGVAELATQAETDAGTDPSRIVTPAKLAARTATEERRGLVELATVEETRAGTDAARAVNPAGLKAAVTPEAWAAPVLLNGWSNFGAPHAAAGYRRTPWGEVQLRGLVKGGSTANATVVLTLPAGYRPAETRNFPATAGGNTTCRLQVNSEGSVAVYGVTDNTYLTLEAVRFDA